MQVDSSLPTYIITSVLSSLVKKLTYSDSGCQVKGRKSVITEKSKVFHCITKCESASSVGPYGLFVVKEPAAHYVQKVYVNPCILDDKRSLQVW